MFQPRQSFKKIVFEGLKSFSSKKKLNELSSDRFEELLDEFYIRYEVFGGPVNNLNDYEKVQIMITKLDLEKCQVI